MTALQALEILYIHDNRLGTLPDWLGELRGLTYLNAAENGLASLPELAGLSNLIELRLMHNLCAAVPEAVRGLPELRILDLRANRLAGALPQWLAELPRLEKLDLRWNSFDDPPVPPELPGCVVLVE
jgi:Leucine-rich repeat (LRR) protein